MPLSMKGGQSEPDVARSVDRRWLGAQSTQAPEHSSSQGSESLCESHLPTVMVAFSLVLWLHKAALKTLVGWTLWAQHFLSLWQCSGGPHCTLMCDLSSLPGVVGHTVLVSVVAEQQVPPYCLFQSGLRDLYLFPYKRWWWLCDYTIHCINPCIHVTAHTLC